MTEKKTPVIKHAGINRVFNLHPFWLSFAFMALVSLPMSFVALPITAAAIGPLPAIGIIILITLVMILSTCAIAEAIVLLPDHNRPQTLDGLVRVYLGPRVANVTAIAVALIFFVVLVACAIAITTALSAFTGMSELLWLLIFAIVILIVITVGSIAHSLSLVAGGLAVILIMTVIIALFPYIDFERLLYIQIPFMQGRGLAPELWSGFLGIMILSFIGPILLVPCATHVLPRNPHADLFIRGSIYGLIFQAATMILWVLAVDIAVMPGQLIGLHGTVFVELGKVTNPFIKTLGAILILILPGLAGIRSAGLLSGQMLGLVDRIWPSPSLGTHIARRRVIQTIPTIAALLLVAFLIEEDKANVSAFLSVGGILGSSIATSIVPMMLYATVIRNHKTPALPFLRLLRNRIFIYGHLLFISLIVVTYGLVVWDSLAIQIMACLIAAGAMIQLAILFSRHQPTTLAADHQTKIP